VGSIPIARSNFNVLDAFVDQALREFAIGFAKERHFVRRSGCGEFRFD
jgi:hypothetical protein